MGWQIVGDTFTLFGTGPVPRVIGGPEPGPVTPPPPARPPPAPEPVVVPLPSYSTEPFVFPGGGPGAYDPDRGDRYYAVARIGGDNDFFYAAEKEAGNPSINSHAYAGIIQGGRYATYRLWVPTRAATTLGAVIRQVLATGGG